MTKKALTMAADEYTSGCPRRRGWGGCSRPTIRSQRHSHLVSPLPRRVRAMASPPCGAAVCHNGQHRKELSYPLRPPELCPGLTYLASTLLAASAHTPSP